MRADHRERDGGFLKRTRGDLIQVSRHVLFLEFDFEYRQ
jgi:hypothetical protein